MGILVWKSTDLAERKKEAADNLTDVKAQLELDPENIYLLQLKEAIEKWQTDNA
tara:strand:+ start:569 stop:730 length:162 start_codon:yes stop_codon:yes gene_type:complete